MRKASSLGHPEKAYLLAASELSLLAPALHRMFSAFENRTHQYSQQQGCQQAGPPKQIPNVPVFMEISAPEFPIGNRHLASRAWKNAIPLQNGEVD